MSKSEGNIIEPRQIINGAKRFFSEYPGEPSLTLLLMSAWCVVGTGIAGVKTPGRKKQRKKRVSTFTCAESCLA